MRWRTEARRRDIDTGQIGVVLAELMRYIRTTEDCYVLVRDGWPSFRLGDPMPKVSIPNRDYVLFFGTLADFPEWNSRIEALLADIGAPTPAGVAGRHSRPWQWGMFDHTCSGSATSPEHAPEGKEDHSSRTDAREGVDGT